MRNLVRVVIFLGTILVLFDLSPFTSILVTEASVSSSVEVYGMINNPVEGEVEGEKVTKQALSTVAKKVRPSVSDKKEELPRLGVKESSSSLCLVFLLLIGLGIVKALESEEDR